VSLSVLLRCLLGGFLLGGSHLCLVLRGLGLGLSLFALRLLLRLLRLLLRLLLLLLRLLLLLLLLLGFVALSAGALVRHRHLQALLARLLLQLASKRNT